VLLTSCTRLSSSWSSPKGGYSLPSSSGCSSYVLLLRYMSVMSSSSSVPRLLPFHFASTRLSCEWFELNDCFGVSADRDDPVGDGGEDTTRWGASLDSISNLRSFVRCLPRPLEVTSALVPLVLGPQTVVTALQDKVS
jgi:hypothetical protein